MGLEWLFQVKSKEQIEAERAEYNAKVFPYGASQQETLKKLVRQLCPKEYEEMTMYYYLVVRDKLVDYYDKASKTVSLEGYKVCFKTLKKLIRRRLRDDSYLYIALAEIDLSIDESLNYDIEAIKKKAEEIKMLSKA